MRTRPGHHPPNLAVGGWAWENIGRMSEAHTPRSQNRPPSGGRRRPNPRPRRNPPRPFSAEQVEARRASVPQIVYPEQLPVSTRREEIAAAIRDHQVVVVAGETG